MFDHIIYQRRRKDRWWRYLVLKEAFTSAELPGGKNTDRDRLQWATRRIGMPVSEPLYEFWHALLSISAERCASLQGADQKRVRESANGLSVTDLPPEAWLDLSRFSMGLGLFLLANDLREKFLDRVLIDAQAPGAELQAVFLACYACTERGEYDQAQRWLDRVSALGGGRRRLSQARWFVGLLSKSKSSGYPGTEPESAPVDKSFGGFVRGQRVALVGPVAPSAEHGAEIDAHDIIVKLGYRGGTHGCDPVFQGHRIDISYYNNTQCDTLAGEGFRDILEPLRWAVCHNRKGAACFQPAPVNLRQVQPLHWMLPDTHLNAGPNAILDLLRFKPAGIRVYNTDMMLSAGRFAGYRKAGNEETDYTRSFIKTHDPILQYRIMHRLWSAGWIKGDQRFEEVMGMGLDLYLGELQKVYGADRRALF